MSDRDQSFLIIGAILMWFVWMLFLWGAHSSQKINIANGYIEFFGDRYVIENKLTKEYEWVEVRDAKE